MEGFRKELEEQELETVTGGAGAADGYNYVSLYFEGGILMLYAGFDVSGVNVYQNGSHIRYTWKMTAGQTERLDYSQTAPLLFQVTGTSIKYSEKFDYHFEL